MIVAVQSTEYRVTVTEILSRACRDTDEYDTCTYIHFKNQRMIRLKG